MCEWKLRNVDTVEDLSEWKIRIVDVVKISEVEEWMGGWKRSHIAPAYVGKSERERRTFDLNIKKSLLI